MSFADGTHGWITGDDKVFRTNDGGTTWRTEFESDQEVFVSVSFPGSTQGWVLSYGGTVLRYE
jgi:photosystem II stability/assembly factor-like uncharacterized protein